ncbi:MAG: hypothetical protein ABIH46_05725 [Chloroflexota bacterium]
MHKAIAKALAIHPPKGLHEKWQWPESVAFQYKLSRHKTVRIVGRYPKVQHWPYRGAGSKGFVLRLLTVKSINGERPQKTLFEDVFALNRVSNLEEETLAEVIMDRIAGR